MSSREFEGENGVEIYICDSKREVSEVVKDDVVAVS